MAMRYGIVVFPGSNCEQDVVYALRHLGMDANYVWHQDTSLAAYDAVILPGGFSYGDYLRCGAIARFSPVMDAVARFANDGGPVLGICNGFQILTEAHLLPGALIRNVGLKFICEHVRLRVEKSVCQWLDMDEGATLVAPINHNEGNFICDAATLARLEERGQVVLRYCDEAGAALDGGRAPNGSLAGIAGVCNEAGNVFGLMPHPERVVDGISGGRDGAAFFLAIKAHIDKAATR
jgi:phosphoribosylformylglycinamidine synthase